MGESIFSRDLEGKTNLHKLWSFLKNAEGHGHRLEGAEGCLLRLLSDPVVADKEVCQAKLDLSHLLDVWLVHGVEIFGLIPGGIQDNECPWRPDQRVYGACWLNRLPYIDSYAIMCQRDSAKKVH